MAVDVKQLVVKGTVLQQAESPRELESVVDESNQVAMDEEEILTQCRRNWREEQRQRGER
jgi:hypothetical protein